MQEGAYALIFKSALFPHEAIAARRGSPLLLGIKQESPSSEAINVLPSSPSTPVAISGANVFHVHATAAGKPAEYFLASDASAIVEHTRQVLYLEDADLLHITPSGPYMAAWT